VNSIRPAVIVGGVYDLRTVSVTLTV